MRQHKARATGVLAMRSHMIALAALALSSALLSSCGSSQNSLESKSGQQILAAATEAARNASAVHVVSKHSQGRLSLTADLHLTTNGGRGRLSFLQRGYEVIRIGDTIYLKGTKPVYESLSRALGKPVHVPDGTWLKAPATVGAVAQLAAFLDLHSQLARLLSSPGTITRGSSKTINGQKAITLNEKTKVYEGPLYIAADGQPYPIEQVRHGAREQGRTTYSEWNTNVPLSAPSPVVELG